MLVVFGGHNESMRKHLLIRNLGKFVVSWLPKVSINSWMQCRLCRATSHKLYVPWERLFDIIIIIMFNVCIHKACWYCFGSTSVISYSYPLSRESHFFLLFL